MNIENDETFAYPVSENFIILYSTIEDKWAVETPDDSFTVDDSSFEEDIIYEEDLLSLKDFHKVQAIILKRIKDEKALQS